MYDFKVGFTCNNDCIHCVVADKRKLFPEDFTTDQLKEIIMTKVLPLGEDAVILTGGEITIRKDFVEIVKFINSKGLKIVLQTNGTGLADENVVKEIAPFITNVLVAIHSCYENIHNLIVDDKTNTMYKKTIQGIRNLKKYEIPFETQTVISSLNFYTLYDTYKFIQENWPGTLMCLTYPHAYGNAALYKEAVCMKFSHMKPELHRILKDFGKFLATEAIPLCYLYPYEKTISYISDEFILRDYFTARRKGLDPSNRLLGNDHLIDPDGFSKNYSENDLLSRKKGPLCVECSFNNKCPGVWKEYVEMYKHSLDLFPIKVPVKFGTAVVILRHGLCENVCVFCSGNNGDHTNIDEDLRIAKESIDSFTKDNKLFLEISGEPLSHPYLLDVLRYAKEKGIENIQVSTNGRRLSDRSFVRKLREAGMTHCRIPLYGSTEEIHNKIVSPRMPGNAFTEAVAGIKNCADEGIIVCAHTVLHQYNKADLKNMVNLYNSLTNKNMKEFVVGPVGISVVDYDYTKDWFLPAKDCGSYVSNFLNDPELDTYPYPIKVMGIPYCTIGRYDDRIMALYEAPDIGVKKDVGINSSKANPKIPHYSERIHVDICTICCFNKECDGLLKNDEILFGHDGLNPVVCSEEKNV